MTKQYYSVRIGKNKNFFGFDLKMLKRLFLDLFTKLENKGYFQQYFGCYCIDAPNNWIYGELGEDLEAEIFRLLRKDNLWPIKININNFSEDDLFDMIEFLYDHVSGPVETPGAYHSYGGCGWHFSKFDRYEGIAEYWSSINEILAEYTTGFELSTEGLIVIKDRIGLANIYEAEVPTDRNDIKIKIDFAIQKYRESRSNHEIRRVAIRELADILEILKKETKTYLHDKDESDLFNIVNNFSIRHANDKQKINYDRDIWYSWMFYFYLATIHALLRIKEREK
jgi:hypothetical protein